MDERLTYIEICGKKYPMMLSVWATKQIVKRFGGLQEVGEKMQQAEYSEQIDSVVWLLMILINAGIMYCNYKDGTKEPQITQEMIEGLSNPSDFIEYRDAVYTAMNKGAERHIRSEEGIDEKNAERA